MHTFYENKPTSTVTDLYAEADKVISLSKTNCGNNGLGKRAAPGNRGPQSQQRDNSFKQRPYDGKTQSRKRDNSFKQRPNQDKSAKPDIVCSKCQNKGHSVTNCRSIYTKNGKYIGNGEPPANHYWTKRHAEEAFEKEVLRQKQAAMVKKKFLKPPQPAQKKKSVQSLTVPEPLVPSVLSVLDNSDISEFSDAESDFTVDERTVSTCADKTNSLERTVNTCADKTNSLERTVNTCADKTNSSKPNPWDLDSLDLDLEQWRLNKSADGKRPLTKVALSRDGFELKYQHDELKSLKGPAPKPSANAWEHKFVKRKNMVKR
jgi:hypothetical protein